MAGIPLRAAADPWVLRRRSSEQIVSRDTQGAGQRWDVVQREATLA